MPGTNLTLSGLELPWESGKLIGMKRRDFLERSILLITGAGIIQGTSRDSVLKLNDPISLRFAVASDGHYGQEKTEFDLFHDEMMGWLREEHENRPLAFCMFNGDLVHNDPTLFPSVKAKFESLNIPFYVTRGNHDRCDAETWRQAWGCELNYSFEINDNAFVALDTSDINGNYLCPSVNKTKKAFHKHRKCKNLFVFAHIPSHHWTPYAVNCPKIMSMFRNQKNLRAIFHGHEHDKDDAVTEGGQLRLFDAHMGGNWGTKYRGYRIVEIFESGDILTYQVNPHQKAKVNSNRLA